MHADEVKETSFRDFRSYRSENQEQYSLRFDSDEVTEIVRKHLLQKMDQE